jgi:hypothetical protein
MADWAATTMTVVFLVAFVAKARSAQAFDDFAASLSQFGIDGINAQRLAAMVVLLAEAAAVAGLLLLPAHPLARFALPILLLIGFAVGIAASERRGQLTACHCFGASTELPTKAHLLLNGGLAALGLLAIGAGRPTASAGETVLGIGLGVISGALFVGSSDLYLALSTSSPVPARGRHTAPTEEKVG